MKHRYLVIPFLLSSIASSSLYALDHDEWATVSDVGVYTLMGTALTLPAVQDDWEGVRQAGFSIAFATGVSLIGKAVVKEERPDNSDDKSFPSGHTADAFASATTLYLRHGWQVGFPAYALATLTGGARVAADKHYVHDVIAGAIVGATSGWLFTDAFDENVQLNPWLDTDGAGVNLTLRW